MDTRIEAEIRAHQERIEKDLRIQEAIGAPNVSPNADGSYTLRLAEPLKLRDGSTKSELTIRRPRPKDFKAIAKIRDDGERAEALFSALTGVPADVLGEMDFAEYGQGSLIVAELVGKARATGSSS